MDAAIDFVIKQGSYIGLMIFLVIKFLAHIEKKDETTKELTKSVDSMNLSLLSLQKDNQVKDQVLTNVSRALDHLSDTLSKLECTRNVRP